MGSIQLLGQDLGTLVADSKRRNAELSASAEKSLEILFFYKKQQPRDADVFSKLSEDPHFILPIIAACSSGNIKFTTVGLQALNRLSMVNAIPAESIEPIIDSLTDAAHLAMEIQLKILQLLPVFYKQYGLQIKNDLLVKLFACCGMLMGGKVPVVVSTASATMQQLVVLVFDQLRETGDDEDAEKVLNDLCLVTEQKQPDFLKLSVSESYGLELLESVLTNHVDLIQKYETLATLVKTKVVPLTLRLFSASLQFPVVVRSARNLLLLLRTQLQLLSVESEVIVSMLTHVLTPDADSQYWKKILSLEIFAQLVTEFKFVSGVFSSYDDANGIPVFQGYLDVLAALVNHLKDAMGIQHTLTNGENAYISIENAALKVPFLDLLDKADPPHVDPTSYIYLIHQNTVTLSESIAKHVLQLCKSKSGFTFLEKNAQTESIYKLLDASLDSIVDLHTDFLYSSTIDNVMFFAQVKSVQRLTHAVGALKHQGLESLFNIFAIASVRNTIAESDMQPRTMNSRQVSCFRALISLSTSLGVSLNGEIWRLVLLPLQWINYYIEGPSEDFLDVHYSKQIPSVLISQTDYNSIENTLKKFNESTTGYSMSDFNCLIDAIQNISQEMMEQEHVQPFEGGKFVPSGYNRSYFVELLGDICKLNSALLSEEVIWDKVSNYLILVSSDQSISSPFIKTRATEVLCEIIESVSNYENFSESLVVKTLVNHVNKLMKIDVTENKVESKMILNNLQTLNKLLDQHGESLSHSWDFVLDIIHVPFVYQSDESVADSLVKSSFETLQLVCNDFLQTLPMSIIEKLVSILGNFVKQQNDLNISFSAVGYFWSISDFLKSNKNTKDLLLLLETLVEICEVANVQVNNSIVQTVFKIIDSSMPWSEVHQHAISPLLQAQVSFDFTASDEIQQSAIDNVKLILEGVVNLYVDNATKLTMANWQVLIDHMNSLVSLGSTDITFQVYSIFKRLVTDFKHPEAEADLLLQFWSSQKVGYANVNGFIHKDNQDCLTQLMDSFHLLYALFSTIGITAEIVTKCLQTLNTCIRYPILPQMVSSDSKKPTALQQAVLVALDSIELNSAEVQSVVVTQLVTNITLPFSTRAKIVSKLSPALHSKIPTFNAICIESAKLLESKLTQVEDSALSRDVDKLMRILIEPIESKSTISTEMDTEPLWVKCTKILNVISSRLKVSSTSGIVIRASTVPFTQPISQFDQEMYQLLQSLILKYPESFTDEQIEQYVKSVWRYSFFYEWDMYENLILENDTPLDTVSKLSKFPFDDIITGGIQHTLQDNYDLHLLCLRDLSRLTALGDAKFSDCVAKYYMSRVAYSLWRLICDQKLVQLAPIPKARKDELQECLQGLGVLLAHKETDVKSIYPLLLQSTSYSPKIDIQQVSVYLNMF